MSAASSSIIDEYPSPKTSKAFTSADKIMDVEMMLKRAQPTTITKRAIPSR